jgi:hypothetical protein
VCFLDNGKNIPVLASSYNDRIITNTAEKNKNKEKGEREIEMY